MKTDSEKKNSPKEPTPFEITQQLTNEASMAVNALSQHLKQVPDLPRMYKANRALHILWDII